MVFPIKEKHKRLNPCLKELIPVRFVLKKWDVSKRESSFGYMKTKCHLIMAGKVSRKCFVLAEY